MAQATSTALQVLSSTLQTTAQAGKSAASWYSNSLIWFDIVGAVLSITFFIAALYIYIKIGWIKVRVTRVNEVILKRNPYKRRVSSTWDDIERHFFKGDDNDLKIAIVKADALLDEALKEAGILGSDLGDRLKNTNASQLPNIQNVWDAHKLRNRIAHEPEFKLKRDTAERALTIYEEALEHLGALAEIPSTIEEAKESYPEDKAAGQSGKSGH